MARLQTARIAARDLVSTFPRSQGALELDLAAILGITPDVNVTASAVGIDNSGRLTKDQIRQNCPVETPPSATAGAGYGIGWNIEESGSPFNHLTLSQETLDGGQTFRIRPAGLTNDTSFPIFSINMVNGRLTGNVTQDLSHTPLIPATGGASASNFYNAGGHFSVPGVSPSFDGVGLWAVSTDVIGGATASQKWSMTAPSGAPAGFDVGSHFNAVSDNTKVTIPLTAGKFAIYVHLAVYCPNVDPQDVSVEIQKNGTTTLNTRTEQVTGNFKNIAISTLADLVATDFIKVRVTSSLTDDFVSGVDPGIVAAFPQTFSGRIFLYRVE